MTSGISVWAAAAAGKIADGGSPIYTETILDYIFAIHHTDDTIWIEVTWPKGGKTFIRTAYSPDSITLKKVSKLPDCLKLLATSSIGDFNVEINIKTNEKPLLHYTVQFTPALDLFIPFWPRELTMATAKGDVKSSSGDIHIAQTGTRSGLVYASFNKRVGGTLLYFQNLSALADYHRDTQTSAADNVGGRWPEIGLSLPPLPKNS